MHSHIGAVDMHIGMGMGVWRVEDGSVHSAWDIDMYMDM